MKPILLDLKKLAAVLAVSAMALSCGTKRQVVVKRDVPTKTVKRSQELRTLNSYFNGKISDTEKEIVLDAEKYLGAPYKYAGTTSAGFDCSGFTGKVFAENNLSLPRRSMDQALQGREVSIQEVRPGDLVFFATTGGAKVSHVGIIHDIGNDGEIKFIHSSTSKGVVISSLNEKYWNSAYLFVKRIF